MSTTRKYDSSLRRSQAADTRERIQRAARKLFALNGFTDTTVGQIAAESNVSPQTIYATFGSKAAIVASLLEHLEQEAGLPDMVAAITAETNPRAQLHIFVAWIRRLFEMSADIFSAVLQAPGVPELAVIRENGDSNRLNGCRLLAQNWEAAGVVTRTPDTGGSSESVAEQIWLLTSIESYVNCVKHLRWSPDRYERWVLSSLERLLFD